MHPFRRADRAISCSASRGDDSVTVAPAIGTGDVAGEDRAFVFGGAGNDTITDASVKESVFPMTARLERLHLTSLRDAASPPAASLRQQLDRFGVFQRVYKHERPPAALGNDTPAEHYALSPRASDGVLRERARGAACAPERDLRRGGVEIYFGQALAGEPVGELERRDGSRRISYGPVELGIVDHGSNRLRRAKPQAGGFCGSPSRVTHNATGPPTAATV